MLEFGDKNFCLGILIVSDEQLNTTEKTLEDYLIYLLNRLQENGRIKITPIENTSLKYELEILNNSLAKNWSRENRLNRKQLYWLKLYLR